MNKKILLNIIDKNYLLKKFLKIVIYGREYKKTFDYLLKNDSLNIDKEKDLLELLKYSIDNVKFYQKQNIIEMKINKFPLITKKEIFKNEKEFISKKYNIERLNRFSTGGTTGFSLNLYKNKVEISREVAYVDYLFYKIVGKKNYIKGILRSHDTEEGIYKVSGNKVFLSSYKITKENVEEYLKVINELKIECLHILPSAMKILCKYIKVKKLQPKLPFLKGILSSSEVLEFEQKKEILELFPGIKLLDLYGHTEHLNFAVSENLGIYKFYEKYGYTEFRIVEEKENFKIAEIIATGFNNRAMPLIRYKTDDYVQLNSKNEVIKILGRKQDFLIDENNNIIPCIFDTREKTLNNIENFQFYQPKKGILIFKIVVLENYSKTDEEMLYEDLTNAFGKNLKISIKVVDKIEKTIRGKQKRLIQDFNIDEYWRL
ncbi:hypothetical protein I6E36_08920 [Fusobacterium mortiferum]|uniref:hypothetical protein n=1 Tax=Fusobacterium mortiferum TaxID=850 RepID=UPI001F17CD0D|nr:hypothetical protein [Fusobacterium mortiferum]MCF2628205.1 hypothetical protein [Fusobacterium mortiferum]